MKLSPQKIAIGMIGLLSGSCNNATDNAAGNTQDSGKVASVAPVSKPSARPAHWGYSGDVAPAKWASLSPVYSACGEGKSQSPIDLVMAGSGTGSKKLNFDYNTTTLKIAHHEHVDDIIDNGHTIQVTVDEGSTVGINDKLYHLKQFHFHSPSEHTVDGKHAPLEMHMVHQSDDGKLAVVSLLFEEGRANRNLQQIIEHMPTKPGDSAHYKDVKLDLSVHIPKNISAFHYSGSLTTPPCSEQVEWLVLRNKFQLSKDQSNAFAKPLNNNNRPVQELNGRDVGTVKIN